MRRMPSTILLPLVALSLLAPAASAQADAMPQPQPDQGDLWRLQTTLLLDAPLEAPATIRAEGVEQVQVGGESHDAYRVVTTYEGDREGETSTTWYRVSDFAKLQVSFSDPGGETTYALAEPCREWRFPMRVGDAWDTSCTFVAEGDSFTIASSWRVDRVDRASVPAGTFDVVVLVQEGDDFIERWWFAPEACWWVLHESIDGAGNVASSAELTGVEGCEPATGETPGEPTPTTPTEPTGATPTPGDATPEPVTGTPPASPTGTSPVGGTTTTPPTGGAQDGDADTPGPALALLLVAVAGLAIARRSKRS